MPVGSNLTHNPEINHNMASYKRNKSGGTQAEGPSNSASPASSVALSNPSSTQGINNNAPKYGTLVPNRIFVGGISSNTTEAELCQLFSRYGNVKATKIIADRAGVSKGYGFVTFDTEEEVRSLIQDSNNIVLKERKLNIAPAVKKQPSFSRSFDASSPPPATPNLYFHNGVPYTFHNGMAFFPPNPHQPTIAALPHSADTPIYQSYGPTQNSTAAPYGTPVLVPAPPPMFMPQNYSYQPLPMTNGAATQYIYPGSGSANGNAGSATPDNAYMSAPQFFPQQYPPPDAFYPQSMFVYPYNGDYEALEHQAIEGRSSTATTPQSDTSDRSSNQSPGNIPHNTQDVHRNMECNSRVHSTSPSTQQTVNKPIQETNVDSQVPVVSWKNQTEERELYIRDGRRAFYPAPPPPPPPPPPPSATPPSRGPPTVLLYHNPTFQGSYLPHMFSAPKQNQLSKDCYGQRQNIRGRQRPINTMPYIPKFPDSFNNNNPLILNNNYYDNKIGDVKPQKYLNNRFRAGITRNSHDESPPCSNPFISTTPESFPSPQIVQQTQNHHYERQYGPAATNMGNRWTSHQQILPKRMPFNKRQNGSTQNITATANPNIIRLAKKPHSDVEGDLGGGGDAQPIMELALTPPGSPTANCEATSKMQSLSLGTTS